MVGKHKEIEKVARNIKSLLPVPDIQVPILLQWSKIHLLKIYWHQGMSFSVNLNMSI